MNPVDKHTPLKPALTLSHAVVRWLNAIAAPRTAFQTWLGDTPLSVRMERLVWQQQSCMQMLDCIWRIGEEAIVFSVSPALVDAVASTVQSGLALPSAPTGLLVLELALEPLLARLEAQLQRDMQLIGLHEATTRAPYLEFDIVCGPSSGKARLYLFSPLDGVVPSTFVVFGELLRQLPRQPCDLPTEIAFIVAGEIGSLRVPAGLLRKACAGDALLPDLVPFSRGEITLSVGQLWAPADLAGDHLILRGPFRPRACSLEYAHMMTEPESEQELSEADLDDVEITLVFEFARWTIPLGEFRTAGEGHVFELGRPIEGPVDIVVNGRCIGRGDIVGIGDELGVRLRGKLARND
ncbi:type III secretion protein Q [Sinorhizobium terangae]|nr:type III secretion system cytoplasmic ring protein SctQ [Sinorhizobium terangae]MBB4188996.1 type III secretion protein Q [Sinorhizobium terangae]